MNFLHFSPIYIATLLRFFEPGKLRVSRDHCINGLAHRLLVDLFNVDPQTINSLDRQISLSNQLALAQSFISIAVALGTIPLWDLPRLRTVAVTQHAASGGQIPIEGFAPD